MYIEVNVEVNVKVRRTSVLVCKALVYQKVEVGVYQSKCELVLTIMPSGVVLEKILISRRTDLDESWGRVRRSRETLFARHFQRANILLL
jgi:hypothetical protein